MLTLEKRRGKGGTGARKKRRAPELLPLLPEKRRGKRGFTTGKGIDEHIQNGMDARTLTFSRSYRQSITL